MPIRRYVAEVVFGSDTLSAMSKAFTAAIWSLGIGRDELKREAVAKFIIGLAQKEPDLDAAILRDRVVAALGDPTNGGEPQYEPDLGAGAEPQHTQP
jgi:hypothetical protein